MSRQSIFRRGASPNLFGAEVPSAVLSFPWFFLSPFIVRPRPSVRHRPVPSSRRGDPRGDPNDPTPRLTSRCCGAPGPLSRRSPRAWAPTGSPRARSRFAPAVPTRRPGPHPRPGPSNAHRLRRPPVGPSPSPSSNPRSNPPTTKKGDRFRSPVPPAAVPAAPTNRRFHRARRSPQTQTQTRTPHRPPSRLPRWRRATRGGTREPRRRLPHRPRSRSRGEAPAGAAAPVRRTSSRVADDARERCAKTSHVHASSGGGARRAVSCPGEEEESTRGARCVPRSPMNPGRSARRTAEGRQTLHRGAPAEEPRSLSKVLEAFAVHAGDLHVVRFHQVVLAVRVPDDGGPARRAAEIESASKPRLHVGGSVSEAAPPRSPLGSRSAGVIGGGILAVEGGWQWIPSEQVARGARGPELETPPTELPNSPSSRKR